MVLSTHCNKHGVISTAYSKLATKDTAYYIKKKPNFVIYVKLGLAIPFLDPLLNHVCTMFSAWVNAAYQII
jgi:hypothetical protein